VRLEAGSCVHQPPEIRHRELGHSKDIEMLEVVLPANFQTEEVSSATASQPFKPTAPAGSSGEAPKTLPPELGETISRFGGFFELEVARVVVHLLFSRLISARAVFRTSIRSGACS